MAADRGFVLLWRKFWDSDMFKSSDPFSEREAWLYLFSNLANGIEKNGLPRGQFEASIRYLAHAWRWPRTNVHRFLAKLQREKMIEKVGHQVGHQVGHLAERFIVCNYETYQKPWDSKRDRKWNSKRDKSKEGLKERLKEGTSSPSLFENQKSSGDSVCQARKPSVKTAAPENFEVTSDMAKWAAEKAPSVDIASQTEAFLDHHRARGNKFVLWELAWKNWMRNEQSGRFGNKPAAGRARTYQDVHDKNQATLLEIMEAEHAKHGKG